METELTSIPIEVVFALPDEQRVVPLNVMPGTTVVQAVRLSGLLEQYPDIANDALQFGIYGQVVPAESEVGPGDRVEIYRPLIADPKQARRRRAARRG